MRRKSCWDCWSVKPGGFPSQGGRGLSISKEALRRISRLLKMAATYSPTTRSTIGDAVSLCCPRPSPLSAAPARRRRAHRRPPRASDALREGYGATHSWDIKDMVSLKKVSLFFERPLGARGYSRACCVLGSLEAMS